jgi:hypothetical protein
MISLASEAFRTMAISSGSQPKSAARSRRTFSSRGSRTCHMSMTGMPLEKRRSRIIASRTCVGAGETPPLLRFTRARSTSKADWMRLQ